MGIKKTNLTLNVGQCIRNHSSKIKVLWQFKTADFSLLISVIQKMQETALQHDTDNLKIEMEIDNLKMAMTKDNLTTGHWDSWYC